MQVVITGGTGMIGKKLARAILKRGTVAGPDGQQAKVDRLVLFDVMKGEDVPEDPRVTVVQGEIYDVAAVRKVIAGDTGSVFHLAAVVSAGAEADFDLGYKVNLDGTRVVLEACRALARPPRVLFASSVAVFGGDLPPVIEDDTPLVPQTSYGNQKAMGELFISDYTRKGFIDGRSLRLPTICVRPGKPNLAASTFASSILREPLKGEEAICPVSPDVWMPLLSPRRTAEAFLFTHDLPSARLGMNRTMMLPSLDVTVQQMADALKSYAGAEAYSRIKWVPDARIQKIVDGWPKRLNSARARSMGLEADPSVEAIIQAFVEDDLGPNQR